MIFNQFRKPQPTIRLPGSTSLGNFSLLIIFTPLREFLFIDLNTPHIVHKGYQLDLPMDHHTLFHRPILLSYSVPPA